MELKMIYIWGAQRTGTNYMESLCKENFQNPVANLNKDKSEYMKYGSKHDLDMNLTDKIDPDGIHIVMIKNPVSWVFSKQKFEEYCRKVNPNHVRKEAYDYIPEEYNDFYKKMFMYFELSSRINRVHFVRYEDLITDFKDVMESFIHESSSRSGFVERDRTSWKNIDRVCMPSNQKSSTTFDRNFDPDVMYHNHFTTLEKSQILSMIDVDMLSNFGYNVDGTRSK